MKTSGWREQLRQAGQEKEHDMMVPEQVSLTHAGTPPSVYASLYVYIFFLYSAL